jgi:hypothetical protein
MEILLIIVIGYRVHLPYNTRNFTMLDFVSDEFGRKISTSLCNR